MDSTTYQQRAMSRRMPGTREADLVLGSLGLVREASEAIEHIERELFFDTPLDPEKIKVELGDTLWYMVLLARALGFTLEDIMDANDAKLEKRYGDKFTYDKWRADREARGLTPSEPARPEMFQPNPTVNAYRPSQLQINW